MLNFRAPNFRTLHSTALTALLMLTCMGQGQGTACSLTENNLPWKKVTNAIDTRKVLHDYDVALLIDSSHSMKYDYVPEEEFLETQSDIAPSTLPYRSGCAAASSIAIPSASRWEWCRAHTAELTKDSMSVLNHGPRLTVFGDRSIMYKDEVTSESVANVFKNVKPHGGTFAARALKQELNDYFQHRKVTNGRTKPLLIAMITDGSLSDVMSSRQVLVEATHKMNRSDEIAVVILKVGQDSKAPETIELLDNGLVSKYNAKFDIVEVRTFDELNSRGIGPVLADVMKEKRATREISYSGKSI